MQRREGAARGGEEGARGGEEGGEVELFIFNLQTREQEASRAESDEHKSIYRIASCLCHLTNKRTQARCGVDTHYARFFTQ